MPRTSAAGPLTALTVLTDAPESTSDLYEKVGYAALMRAGMIPYRKFRSALAELEAEGLASSQEGEDGDTLWCRTASGASRQAQRAPG
jgi:hypothetical protein